jgi:hypothetical protein
MFRKTTVIVLSTILAYCLICCGSGAWTERLQMDMKISTAIFQPMEKTAAEAPDAAVTEVPGVAAAEVPGAAVTEVPGVAVTEAPEVAATEAPTAAATAASEPAATATPNIGNSGDLTDS